MHHNRINKDDKTEYLHLILASGADECSRASLKDVFRFQKIMKLCFCSYKTAFILYMGKGNKQLKKEMTDQIFAIQEDQNVD